MTITYRLDQVADVVTQHLIPLMPTVGVFTFAGPLGAGKTTMIKSFLSLAGVAETVTSPTFTYVNSYSNDRGQTFHHFDLYRLSSVEEFVAAGFDEYLGQENGWCFIEWPGVIAALLDESEVVSRTLDCTLRHIDGGSDERELSFAMRSGSQVGQ